jgi:hypothetical protein
MYNSDLPTRAELPTTPQLMRSTAIAIAAAAGLLVTVVLPAEYAIDPTGAGRLLGLTEMGEIKRQLAEEAAADEAASQRDVELPTSSEPDALAEEVVIAPEVVTAPASSIDTQLDWKDEITITLAPGEAAEVKLTIKQSDTATYAWAVDQGHLNSDLHGDGANRQSTSYRKGRAETTDSGELVAAFDGTHGWFWRNRSDVTVKVTLKTNGAYTVLKRVI